ncbi:MAG TPA: bifunctional chorismate mutase/prephenate dehydrogenase [Deferrisomatales bacterium]|nr:bifunctional chorismate mutase/prephenate dehydrogenase [Deferrisomatales bacterium]
MKPDSNDLASLRDKIDDLDRRLVDLLAERGGVVAEVAEWKRAHDQPVYHPAREEDLISRRRAQGLGVGLDPDLVEDIFRRVMRDSRQTQGATLASHGVRPGARVLVVGGAGAMGRCLTRWFSEAGYRVAVLDRDDWGRVEPLCEGAELTILSVPIEATAAVAARLAPHLPARCVLADVTSIKSGPMAAMLAAHPGPVLGLHPMFGPTTTSLDKQIVVATPGREAAACQWLLDQLAAWGAVIVTANAADHDETMGFVQALRHFASFAFGQYLYRKGVDLHRTLDFSAPIYRLELGMVGRLFAQDPGLYAEIIFATPERRTLLREYIESVAENVRMIEAGDRDTFIAEFGRIAEWFGPFSDQAIRESSYLIDKLVERF